MAGDDVSQKIENLLNLALDATSEERTRSEELDVGYSDRENTWELIVKYSGTLERTRELTVSVTELLNGYAVIVVEEERIPELAQLPEIDYIEKPKSLYFQVENGRRTSCIDAVQTPPFFDGISLPEGGASVDGEELLPEGGAPAGEEELLPEGGAPAGANGTLPDEIRLTGSGILIGIVDSGIDYRNQDFQNADGTTRIVALWDQSVQGRPPAGYAIGTEYTREDINAGNINTTDLSGHGTAVAGIAAGNGLGSAGQRYRGVAYESELIIVKMAAPRPEGFPRTTELMQGVDYVIRKAAQLGRPVAVNISFGNAYGSHDGTSLLERFLDDIADTWKNVICVGTGNEGNTAGHAAGNLLTRTGSAVEWNGMSGGNLFPRAASDMRRILESGSAAGGSRIDEASANRPQIIELAVQDRERTLSIQIWKPYEDEVQIELFHPSGEGTGIFPERLGAWRTTLGGTQILVYYGEPKPYSVKQEIYLSLLPESEYIDSGVWQIAFTPVNVVDGMYQMWLPVQSTLNIGTAFLRPVPELTLTIPSTSARVITVGAYDALRLAYADFSGRGGVAPGRMNGYQSAWKALASGKPDLAAPGVRVMAPSVGGGYRMYTGTSFAVPFVTGAAALLMEWGIVQGNDPYLYGEKVKAYLRRGANPLPGIAAYPNAETGWGALCVEDSLPV